MEDDIRLLIVADDPLVRAGLALLLADAELCVVVGQFSTQEMAADSAEILADADLVVWDAGWSAEDTPLLAEWDLPLVALIGQADQASTVWTAGARAILGREVDPERLEAAIVAVMHGLIAVDPAFSPRLLPSPDTNSSLRETLTPREQEVLQLLAEGLTNKAIAQRLTISDHTVKFHVNALMGKLNAQSRTEAVVVATRLGLISL